MKRAVSEKYNLAALYPKLIEEWDYEKNYPLRPENVTPYSNKKVWWLDKCGHSYDARIYDRSGGHGCPYCDGKRACEDNCLATLNSKLAKEWHPTKNGKLTPHDVTIRSGKYVWWLDKMGHEYRSTIKDRSNSHGCPYCSGKKVCKDNCLAILNPKLSKELDRDKNGELTPWDLTCGSAKEVWWKCKNKHYFLATVRSRSAGDGCPYCSGRKVCKDNCLATKNPELIKEWHPTKNGKLTPWDVTANSGKKVWWLDKNGHEYEARVADRSRGSGCPICQKIELKNGAICDSLPEAYYYLKLKSKKIKFQHHIRIGLGKCSCDFYIPSTNQYIEVTSFNSKNWRHWKEYRKGIIRKKNRVIKTLHANFEFIQLKLNKKQIQYVRENSI